MTSTLRRIEPLKIPDMVVPDDLGPLPELIWVAPTDLWVDPTYQRDSTERTIKLIKRILKKLAWNKMKPPIGVRTNGHIHLIDGQHTAIAFATARVDRIPVFVVAAEALEERARSFVAHNTDRVTVQPMAVYKALLAAGDPDAVLCQTVLDKAGVRLRTLSQQSEVRIGDTAAFSSVQGLVKDQGPMRARIVLETLVKAECAPINGHQIRATNHLLWLNDPRVTPDSLWPVILADGEEGMRNAQAMAKHQRTQVWRVLADRWQRRCHGKSKSEAA